MTPVTRLTSATNKPMDSIHTAAPTLWWSSPWKSMDHLKFDGWFPPFKMPGVPCCSGRVFRNVPKGFGRTISNKIVPTKVVMKRLLQRQLSNFCYGFEFVSSLLQIRTSQNFTNNFATSLSDPGCRVQSRVGNSTGIISGTTSPQGKGFVIAHGHWCSRWLLNFYPKDHQPWRRSENTQDVFTPPKKDPMAMAVLNRDILGDGTPWRIQERVF